MRSRAIQGRIPIASPGGAVRQRLIFTEHVERQKVTREAEALLLPFEAGRWLPRSFLKLREPQCRW